MVCATVFEASETHRYLISLSLPVGNLGQTGNPYQKNRAERDTERERERELPRFYDVTTMLAGEERRTRKKGRAHRPPRRRIIRTTLSRKSNLVPC
jgi:hypothetical protein